MENEFDIQTTTITKMKLEGLSPIMNIAGVNIVRL